MMIEYQVTEHRGKNSIVRIHKPILTDEEQKLREDETKKALIKFYKEMRSKNV